jgi:hypothetical protein
MTVYVLLKCRTDDPSEILGVYKDGKDAEERCDEHISNNGCDNWTWFEIHEQVLNTKIKISTWCKFNLKEWELQ